MIIVLRAKPSIIEKRLKKRGYSERKIRENMEAEGVDVISIESKEAGKEAFEIDTSEANVHKVADYIVKIVTANANEREKYKDKYGLGIVNWSDEILGWY
jgi:adenylate kinase